MGRATACLDSPLGPLAVRADERGIVELCFDGTGPPLRPGAAPLLRETARQLAEWFAGRRTAFDLPLAPAGTPFQQAVWRALREIPYGATTSYGALARRLGRPGAARAVGAANGRNPLPILVPCHRVIGGDGGLVGFGGGLRRKRWLLAFECARGTVARAGTARDAPGTGFA